MITKKIENALRKCQQRLNILESEESINISITYNNGRAGRVTIQIYTDTPLVKWNYPTEEEILKWVKAFECGLLVAGVAN